MEYYESIEQEELIYPRWPGTLFFFFPRKQFLGQWKEDRNLSGVCVIGDGMGWGGRAFLAEGIGCVKTMK